MYQSKIETTLKIFRSGMRFDNYVSVSGGKDSLVMLHIASKHFTNFKAIMIHNEFEDDEVIGLSKRIYNDLEIVKPTPTFAELIIEYGKPRLNYRWCCYHMRKKWSYEFGIPVIFLGIRGQESKGREGRGEAWKFRNRVFIAPLFYWTESDIWQYSADNKITQWSGYHRGEKRFSCTNCPYRISFLKRAKQKEKKRLQQA